MSGDDVDQADAIGEVLEGLTPIGEDHPAAAETAVAVAAEITDRMRRIASAPTSSPAGDATGVARPGDVLVLGYDSSTPIDPAAAADMKNRLHEALPGLADIVLVPLQLVAIYRGGPQ